MSDKREHFGPKTFGGHVLEGWKTLDGKSFHVKAGGADFLVNGDKVQDAIVTTFDNGTVGIRPRYTGTTAPGALKAAILAAAKEWSET